MKEEETEGYGKRYGIYDRERIKRNDRAVKEKQMKKAAAELNFEAAAELRDKLIELKRHCRK